MRKAMLAGVTVLAAAAAAGCSKPANQAAGGEGGRSASEAASPASAVTRAFEPRRKPGLWQMAMSSTGGPGVSVNAEMCVDAATAADFDVQAGKHSKDCTNSRLTPTGNGWTFQSVCKMDGRTMTSQGVVTGDMSSDYAMVVTTRMDPPSGMPADTTTRIQAKWQGPCPAGMKPGAMKLGGMNIGG